MSFRLELQAQASGNGGSGPAVWHDLDLSDPDDRDWLQRASDIGPRARQLLLDPARGQRRVRLEHGFLVTLHGVADADTDRTEELGAVALLIERDRAVTTHTGRVSCLETIRARSAEGCGPRSPLSVLAETVIACADRCENLVAEISDETERMEDRVLSDGDDPPLAAMATLRHRAFRLRRPLVFQRSMLNVIAADRSLPIDAADRRALSAASEHVVCHLETLEDARERLLLLHDRIESQLSARMNRISYSLTVVATVFLPLTFVTGLLGMNVAGMPEAHDPWGFWVVCGVLAVVAVVSWGLMHWQRWI